MAVLLNVNSYVTVAEADLFFADRLDVAAWQSADAVAKGQAVVTATQMLDEMLWSGTAVTENQPLAFPRIFEYFDPKIGSVVYLDGSKIPARITRATLELAYHLLNNDGLLDVSDSIVNLSIGSIKLESMKPASKMPLMVKNMIKPLLEGGGSLNWWRAN
jgi:hypothetical protein